MRKFSTIITFIIAAGVIFITAAAFNMGINKIVNQKKGNIQTDHINNIQFVSYYKNDPDDAEPLERDPEQMNTVDIKWYEMDRGEAPVEALDSRYISYEAAGNIVATQLRDIIHYNSISMNMNFYEVYLYDDFQLRGVWQSTGTMDETTEYTAWVEAISGNVYSFSILDNTPVNQHIEEQITLYENWYLEEYLEKYGIEQLNTSPENFIIDNYEYDVQARTFIMDFFSFSDYVSIAIDQIENNNLNRDKDMLNLGVYRWSKWGERYVLQLGTPLEDNSALQVWMDLENHQILEYEYSYPNTRTIIDGIISYKNY